jgi:hypothetical protein
MTLAFFSVHVKLEEKIMLTAGRDGGLKSLEVLGMLSIRIADENFGRIKLAIQVLCNFCVSRQIVFKNCLKK